VRFGWTLLACVVGCGDAKLAARSGGDGALPDAGRAADAERDARFGADAGRAADAERDARFGAGRAADAGVDVGRAADAGVDAGRVPDAGRAADAAPRCDPPDTVERDGRCVPSCGAAGGNTCVAADSTLCDCLPAIESYDCAVCCARPAYPMPAPHGYHIVVIADGDRYDSIRALADAGQGPIVTSQNKPDDLPWERWARNVHYASYASSEALADDLHHLLCVPGAAPLEVMIDELKPESMELIRGAAERMRARYSQWSGRWGAYVVNGEAVAYPNLAPALDALLDADAIVAPEMYAIESHYCAAGRDAAARDQWLADFFRGTDRLGRFHWLAQRRADRGSHSELTVLFGVTDHYLDGPSPDVFLDRMFYVWATRTGYRGVILPDNGGPGAYKWEAATVGSTSRDRAFAESYQHYGVQGRVDSRLGPVPCR
jgi:hypothetical protein